MLHDHDANEWICYQSDMLTVTLTYEAVQVVGVARVVWDGEAAVTYGHLAFAEGQSEETQLIQQAAQRLERHTHTHTDTHTHTHTQKM